MIDLRIGPFRLSYDSTSWTVSRIAVIQKEGATFGQERETEHGYHHRLSHALADVFDRLAGQEGSESVKALHTAVDAHARALRDAVGEIERQLGAQRHAGAA